MKSKPYASSMLIFSPIQLKLPDKAPVLSVEQIACFYELYLVPDSTS